MLTLIEVKEKQVTRYKQEDNYIPAGKYYHYAGRPTDKEKKCYSLMACQTPQGRFLWLAPYEKWVKRLKDGQLFKEPTINEEPDWDMINFDPSKLRNWQREIVKDVWNHLRSGLTYGKGWIAKLGAGKTLAGLLICQMFEPNECVVAVSRYLHSTWKDQAEEWNLECPILSTYESLHKLKGQIKCLIIDECIAFKNADALRTKKAIEVAQYCEVVIGFTGIATAGKGAIDFRWLRVVSEGCVPAQENAWKFLFGLDTQLKEVGPNKAYITTEWNHDKVSEFVSPYIHIVDPEEIDAELPEITTQFIYCDKPKQLDLVKAGGATAKGIHKRLAQLKQITDGFIYDDEDRPIKVGSPKLEIVKKFVEQLNEPVILVANWAESVKILSETFQEYMPSVISGETKDFAVQIKSFQQGTTDMMIVNAGFSKGMNLQARCRIICFLSVSSKPDDYQQMVGRVYRPGQKKAVQIVHFVCRESVDKRLVELVQAHKECSDKLIDKLLIEELGF